MTKHSSSIFVSKELSKNETYMRDEVGARVSFDLDFRELFVLQKKVQLYYVNGLVDDTTVVEIIKMLVRSNDLESETDKLDEIIKNRLVNQQVDPSNNMDDITDQV